MEVEMYWMRVSKIICISLVILTLLVVTDFQGLRSTGKAGVIYCYSVIPFGWYVLNNVISIFTENMSRKRVYYLPIGLAFALSFIKLFIKFFLSIFIGFAAAPILIAYWIYRGWLNQKEVKPE